MDEILTIPQAFALLLIDPDGRRAVDAHRFDAALGGAVLADLALRGAVSLAGKQVALVNGAGTGDTVLDGTIGSIAASGRPRSAKWWVARIGKRPLRDAVATSLVERGLLTAEQRKTLGLFTSTRYPERDGAPEVALRTAMADVLIERTAPTPYLAAVIGLLDATGTLERQFDLVDRRVVAAITSGDGDWASPAVRGVLQDIQTMAVLTGVVAASAATTAAS